MEKDAREQNGNVYKKCMREWQDIYAERQSQGTVIIQYATMQTTSQMDSLMCSHLQDPFPMQSIPQVTLWEQGPPAFYTLK